MPLSSVGSSGELSALWQMLGLGQRLLQTRSNAALDKGLYIFQSPSASMISLCHPPSPTSSRSLLPHNLDEGVEETELQLSTGEKG